LSTELEFIFLRQEL